MTRRYTPPGRLGLAIFLVCGVALAQDTDDGRKTQVDELARAQGLNVVGLERLGDVPAAPVEGDDPVINLKTALEGYSYVVWPDANGQRQLKILGPKGPPPVIITDYRVSVRRRGAQRIVRGEVGGPGEATSTLGLIIDTGATTVVLPASMLAELEFADDALSDVTLQTANGEVQAKRGVLRVLRLGEVTENDVEVSFVDDDRMAGAALLGMSFLDRFKFTIDDENSELVLIPK